MELFQNLLNRVGRTYGAVDAKLFGGMLPGGAESLASPFKKQLAQKLKNGARRLAAESMNQLPDRANLFARYVTGVGNTKLKLHRNTENALIRATEKTPTTQWNVPVWSSRDAFKKGEDPISFVNREFPTHGPGVPTSGPVNPYGKYDSSQGNLVTQTLGRYMADVGPDTVRVRDTYDMINEVEDPDLVSGKFQPDKALRILSSSFVPGFNFDLRTGTLQNNRDSLTPEEKGVDGYVHNIKVQGNSETNSPLSNAARALMYVLPVKFQPYEIDYTIKR